MILGRKRNSNSAAAIEPSKPLLLLATSKRIECVDLGEYSARASVATRQRPRAHCSTRATTIWHPEFDA
jgi:hypothetical protein